MIKKSTTAVEGTEVAPGTIAAINTPDLSVTDACVARLQYSNPVEIKPFKVRDFDAEARGKTRCALFGQIAGSAFLAGLPLRTIEDFIAAIIKVADAGVAYTFDDPRQ